MDLRICLQIIVDAFSRLGYLNNCKNKEIFLNNNMCTNKLG